MNIAERAFKELFPEKEDNRIFLVKYSSAFNDYNANVKYDYGKIEFRLSRKWKEVSDSIRIGLIQTLLLKMFGEKKNTMNIDLYNTFIKKMSTYALKNKFDPVLETSFERVNDKYFYGMIDKPNLVWGQESFRKLGSYEYGTDSIVISRAFENNENKGNEELLDYIMYHELLHKKHKFYTKNGRSYHHTRLFREKEKQFEDPDVEEKLKEFLRRQSLPQSKILEFIKKII